MTFLRRHWIKFAIAAYIVMGTLAYGHSYVNCADRHLEFNMCDSGAFFAAYGAPLYWLSFVGVAIFED